MKDPTALLDELNQLMLDRTKFEKYWRDCNKYALPSTDEFDRIIQSGNLSAGMSLVINNPNGYEKSVDLYDQTSLWAIERLANGLITLKTPESALWHDLDVDDPLGYKASHEEKVWMQKVRDYLFSVRASPQSGFWPAHKASVRSVCAYGDGFLFIEEMFGRGQLGPWRYEYCPLSECYSAASPEGITNRMFRLYTLTASQVAAKWPGQCSAKVQEMADDPKKRHMPVKVLHAVLPREDVERTGKIGLTGAPWASCFIETETKHYLKEGGYFEFPYIRHAWSRIGARPYCEGPMALALAEIKSLNELAKNELISAQQAVRPPLATAGDNYTRVNLNAGAVNQGLVNGDGKMLVQPIVTHTRPDFAQAVLEARKNSVREMLYLNLWQILIQRPDMTATEALLRNQEKGELLGPVGISFNDGLSRQVDRELGILARKGAFNQDAALAMPESLMKRDVSPRFTSPLDKLRMSDSIVGTQRVLQIIPLLQPVKPDIVKRINADRILERAVEGFNAPADMLFSEEEAKDMAAADNQAAAAAQQLELLKSGGQAAQEIGKGAADLAGGTAAAAASPQISQMVEGLSP
jgi:hypothetical protein